LELSHFELCLEHYSETTKDISFYVQILVWEHHSVQPALVSYRFSIKYYNAKRESRGSIYYRCECSNPIYGTTVNPHNLKRGPGGSSGGEACILGAEASILGWGSDIGGSLRIPSHFCGTSCLKPTSGRLRYA
jgi:hypothetical protein